MKIGEAQFRSLLVELVDENPFACRALLQILDVEFTPAVPTLAVSCGTAPRLLVNLDFLRRHCTHETHVKAVVCHEFLHVLLRHTERTSPLTPSEHLALDAVINAIIHRELGKDYSDFMRLFYANVTGAYRLLRPFDWDEGMRARVSDTLFNAWHGLYDGTLLADDIRDLARDLMTRGRGAPKAGWLGDHEPRERAPGEEPGDDSRGEAMSEAVTEALERALESMNGDGIWRSPKGRGIAARAYANQVSATEAGVERWRRAAWEVLRRHLLPDPRAPKTEDELTECRLPVLSPGDRRSFARALWNPLIPEAAWESHLRIGGGSAQVYLDVSGSMNAEMPLIVTLLARLGPHIRRPFWAFSDVVAPAVIRDNRLHADTTGGTSVSCVLRHLAQTRPRAAVIVTDGYIEAIDRKLVGALHGIRVHAIVTRDGSTNLLARAGIPYTQLGRLPT
jgi:hypothetical protein